MTKRQDLCLQRRSRPEQSDQRQPNQPANISHQPRASPDSTSLASRIEFPTMTTLSTAPDTRYSPEFWMQRTDMHCGAGYRRPEHGELLAEHLKKPTGIGRKTSLLA